MKHKLAGKIITAITLQLAEDIKRIEVNILSTMSQRRISTSFTLPRAIKLALAENITSRTSTQLFRTTHEDISPDVLSYVHKNLASICTFTIHHTGKLTALDKCLILDTQPVLGTTVGLNFNVTKTPRFRKWFNANKSTIFLSIHQYACMHTTAVVQYRIDLEQLTTLLGEYNVKSNCRRTK